MALYFLICAGSVSFAEFYMSYLHPLHLKVHFSVQCVFHSQQFYGSLVFYSKMSSISLTARIHSDWTTSTLSEISLVTINFLAQLSLCWHPPSWAVQDLPIKLSTTNVAISGFFSSQSHLKMIYLLFLLSFVELLKPYHSYCCFCFFPTLMGIVFHIILLQMLPVVFLIYSLSGYICFCKEVLGYSNKYAINCNANRIFIFVTIPR